MTKARVTTSMLGQYSALAAPTAFCGVPLYILAPDFYATNYGLSLTTLGFILLGLRLFDAIQDPLIGALGDRYRRHSGVIITAAALVLWLGVYALFTQNYLSPLIWFVLTMGLAVTAYSVVTINLTALGSLWTKHHHHQTRIAASREAFGLVGLISAISLPYLLGQAAEPDQIYYWFSLILALMLIVAMLLFRSWLATQVIDNDAKNKITHSPLAIIKNLDYEAKRLLLIYLISMIAASIPAVLVIFFVRDLLGGEIYTGLFLMLYFLSGVFFMPIWQRISQAYSKYQAWLLSMLAAIASFIWAFTLGVGDFWQYAIICVGSGIALGGDLMFPPAILADHIHSRQCEGNASTYYALLTLIAKTALAVASAISLPLITVFGFIPSETNDDLALVGLSVGYALVPCLVKGIAAALVWRMFIHNKKGISHANNQIDNNYRSNNHA